MSKLGLRIDDLRVESFSTMDDGGKGRGTVRGHGLSLLSVEPPSCDSCDGGCTPASGEDTCDACPLSNPCGSIRLQG